MHILHVNHALDPVSGGGTAERTFRLARALARAGAHSTVLTLDSGLTAERVSALSPACVVVLPLGRSRLARRFWVPRCSPRRVLRAVGEADVVSLMGHWTVLNALVYAAARAQGKPWVVNPAGALPVYGRSAVLKRLYNGVAGRGLVARASAHIAITPAERASFTAYGVDPAGVAVIPNGVDPDALVGGTDAQVAVLRARLGLGEAPFVLYLGRLAPIKGPDLLIAAFAAAGAAAAPYRLVLAGPDEGIRADLERQAQECGVADRVVFAGPLTGAGKAAAYSAAALLAVPSRSEAMSIVAVEAGALGTPVLLTRACGFDEVETAGGGRVVPATVEGLAEGLRDLLGAADSLPGMGQRLRRLVLLGYTWERAAANYLKVVAGIGS